MSLKYPRLDPEYNCSRWVERKDSDGISHFIPIPFSCECGNYALYGKEGKWYCLDCWLK